METSTPAPALPPRPPVAWAWVGPVAAAKLVLHVVTIAVTPYGLHRDELLYAAMGQHQAFWGADTPPFIAAASAVMRLVLGDTLWALRLLPALFSTLIVVLAALVARKLGGGRRAQALAALAVLCNPVFLRPGALFQPVVFDQLWWTLGFLALALVVREGGWRAWLWLGLACGLGLLTKLNIVFFGAASAVALLLSPQRRALLTPRPWGAVALAVLLGSATVVGQIRLDWPVFAQMEALRAEQLDRVTPLAFITNQLEWGPATLLGLFGLGALLLSPRLRAFRLLGWTALAAFTLLLVQQGKAYYVSGIYPAMGAAGAVWLDHWARTRPARVLEGVTALLLVAYGLVLLPLGLPFLRPEAMERYVHAIGLESALRTNTGTLERLPQDYADMLGWKEMARNAAAVYHALPADQQRDAVVLAANYGEAGALDFYGPRYGLPQAISPHTSFWYWGPGSKPGRVVIALGVPQDRFAALFEEVRIAGRHRNAWAVEEERDVPIYVGTGPRTTLQDLWPSLAGIY